MQSNQQQGQRAGQDSNPASPAPRLPLPPPERKRRRVGFWLAVGCIVMILTVAALLLARSSPTYGPAANTIINIIFAVPNAVYVLIVAAGLIATASSVVQRRARSHRQAAADHALQAGSTGSPARGEPAARIPLSFGRKLVLGLLWSVAGLFTLALVGIAIIALLGAFATGISLGGGITILGFLAVGVTTVQLILGIATMLRVRPLGPPAAAGPPSAPSVRPASVAGASSPTGQGGPAIQAVAPAAHAPSVTSMPLTPAMLTALDHARRKARRAGLIPILVLLVTPLLLLLMLGFFALLMALGQMRGSLSTLVPVLWVPVGITAFGALLGGIVAWGEWRWLKLRRSVCLRATGPITIVSGRLGYQMRLSDRVVLVLAGSGAAPMHLNWGSVDFTQDKSFIFEVRDQHGKTITRAPAYAPE